MSFFKTKTNHRIHFWNQKCYQMSSFRDTFFPIVKPYTNIALILAEFLVKKINLLNNAFLALKNQKTMKPRRLGYLVFGLIRLYLNSLQD